MNGDYGMLRLTIPILTALFTCFAVYIWVASFSSSFQSCASQERSRGTAENGGKQNQTVALVASQLRCATRFADSHNGIITATATVLLFFVTGGLVWTGYQQFKTTRAQLRAYVIAYGTNIPQRPGHFHSHVEIKNTGQTPARKLHVIAQTCVMLHPPPKGFDFSLVDPSEPSVGVLGAGQTLGITSGFSGAEVFKEEFEEATKDGGWLRIYTYGTVFYSDVFGEPKWTQFCFYFQWEDSNHFATIGSQYHNDAT